MCRRQESDIAEQQHFDEALLKALRRWKAYISWELTDEDVQTVDWIESFVFGARMRLKELQGRRAFTDEELEAFFAEYAAYVKDDDPLNTRKNETG